MSDPTEIIKVAKTGNSKNLATLISKRVLEHKKVVVAAIGVQAVNQAVKAIGIANSYVSQKGFRILTVIGFENVQGDVKIVSATRFNCSLD